MAPRRKPRQLKVISGTLRKHRERPPEAGLPALTGPVSPPDWLTGVDALVLWEELVEQLTKARVLTAADTTALAHLCALHGDIVQDYRDNAEVKAAQLAQFRLWMLEFGMTPASRGRARRAAESAPSNPFAELEAMRMPRREFRKRGADSKRDA